MKSKYSDEYNRILETKKKECIKKLMGNKWDARIYNVIEDYSFSNIDFSNNPKVSKQLDLFKDILDIQDLEKIEKLQKYLQEQNLDSFHETIIKDLEYIYKKASVDCLTNFKSADKDELKVTEGIELEQKEGINIYHLKGIPFQILVHEGALDGNSYTGTDNVHVSLICSDKKINTIHNNHRSFVFNDIEASNINFKTVRDAFSRSSDIDQKSETNMLPEEFIANMDDMHYTDWQLVNTQDTILQPDAICVRGQVTEHDINAAKQRGINHIYSIEEEKYQQREKDNKERFNVLLEEYKETFNPNLLAKLKLENPYSREQFIDTIKSIILENKGLESRDSKLINRNINSFFKIYWREVRDANLEQSENGDRLKEQMDEIKKLKDKDEIIIEQGSKEEKKILVEELQYAVQNQKRFMANSYCKDILGASKDINKDMISMLKMIKDNNSLDDEYLYRDMLFTCLDITQQNSNLNDDTLKMFEEVRQFSKFQELVANGRIERSDKTIDITTYFFDKDLKESIDIDRITSKIVKVQEQEKNSERPIAIDCIEGARKISELRTANKVTETSREIKTSYLDEKNIDKEENTNEEK